jgi:putative ABC transport system ATP-binding protein
VRKTDRPGPPVAQDAAHLDAVTKRFGRGGAQVTALRGVSMTIPRATFTAVMGPSGSGKSTLLHCAAGLDRPESGEVYLAGTRLSALSETELTKLRRCRVGFVFQSFNLVPALTVRQNVTLPFRLAGNRPDPGWVDHVIDRVGLAGRGRHRPAELSGGQQQRVAIARALAPRPDVIFADEPTGALDLHTAHEILRLLRDAVDTAAQTVVMVTHDPAAASYADQALVLADGTVVDTLYQPVAAQIAERVGRLEASR